jgi:hypothetical protein
MKAESDPLQSNKAYGTSEWMIFGHISFRLIPCIHLVASLAFCDSVHLPFATLSYTILFIYTWPPCQPRRPRLELWTRASISFQSCFPRHDVDEDDDNDGGSEYQRVYFGGPTGTRGESKTRHVKRSS